MIAEFLSHHAARSLFEHRRAARNLLLVGRVQEPVPIVVFAGLRWDSLPARSQLVLSNLAKTRSVFFLEAPAPVEVDDREFWELECGAPDLLVCRPRIIDPEHSEASQRMAQALLRWLDVDEFVAWLYSTTSFDWAGSPAPSLVIHDRTLEADASGQDCEPVVYVPEGQRLRPRTAPMRFTPF